MFDSLSERLRKTLGSLTGRGRISEADVDAAMREVRLALLEADVNFKVVRAFVARVREKAIGAEILDSVTAGQQVVKIVHDELVELLSAGDRTFHLSGDPAVVVIRSIASAAICTAVSNPKVTSVPGMSLSIVFGTPTIGMPSSNSRSALESVPSPPITTIPSSTCAPTRAS